MSPFIVIVRRECEDCGGSGEKSELAPCTTLDGNCACNGARVTVACTDCVTLRVAVATLEEVHDRIGEALREHGTGDVTMVDLLLINESGGTVGPLPDRTTIEVEPVTCQALYRTLPAGALPRTKAFADGPLAAVIAAFNAREATS